MPAEPGTPAPWPADHVERRPLDRLVPYARNARRHGARQVAEIAASMSEFGWTMPLLIDEQDRIIVGHGRVLGAERLGWPEAPVLVARGWSEKQIRAYRLADNQIALHSSWDNSLLAVELADLRDQGVDLELMGFTAADALASSSDSAGGDELAQAVQLLPAREYAVIMCADETEWERLKVALDLTPVRRGGYKKGSLFRRCGHATRGARRRRAAPDRAGGCCYATAPRQTLDGCRRVTADILVAVPSKGRAGRTPTLAVLPHATLFVPALEVPAYQQMGARNVVAVPNEVRGITTTRNWILRQAQTRRVVMIDDDVRTQGYWHFYARNVTRRPLDEAAWLTEFGKLFEITEQLHYRIWGVGTDGATRAIYPYYPFRFRSYVTASCMGIINDGRTYFDETYPVKEDYELCCRCIVEDGGVVAAQYLQWCNLHWDTAGGCRDYRTHAMEVDCIKRLRRTYRGLVYVTAHKNSPYAIEIKG